MFYKYWKSLRNVDLKNGLDLGTKPRRKLFSGQNCKI